MSPYLHAQAFTAASTNHDKQLLKYAQHSNGWPSSVSHLQTSSAQLIPLLSKARKQCKPHLALWLQIDNSCACSVKGYPTIKSVVGGKTQEYNGERSASAIKTWGLSLIPNKVVTVAKSAQVSDFLQRCGSSINIGKDAASWGVCVLLLTAKTETAPLYKSLSGQYAAKIAFGEARGSNKVLAERFKVDE